MGLAEGSSTEALVISSRTLNFSWRQKSKHAATILPPSLTREVKQPTVSWTAIWCCVYGKSSLRVTCLSSALQWFELRCLCGRLRWPCTGLAQWVCWTGSEWRNELRLMTKLNTIICGCSLSLFSFYFTKREKRDRSSGEALLSAMCWGGKQRVPSLWGGDNKVKVPSYIINELVSWNVCLQ